MYWAGHRLPGLRYVVPAGIHSRYLRTLADTAVAGRAADIELSVRRFFCDDAACGKRTFAEQVDGLTVRYGRHTPSAQQLLERVALALGSRASGRLTAHMAVPTSGSTLLRAIHRLDVPAPPKVEVLGVDEFSLRGGRVFGALLVDKESHRPVDVLPDHTADTFAAWLRKKPLSFRKLRSEAKRLVARGWPAEQVPGVFTPLPRRSGSVGVPRPGGPGGGS